MTKKIKGLLGFFAKVLPLSIAAINSSFAVDGLERQQIDFPVFLSESKKTGNSLPKINLPTTGNALLMRGVKFQANRFEFSGNTVFSNQQLDALAKSYLEKPVSISELYELRDQITQAYIRKGYLNSGAVLPEQEIRDGVVRIDIVEGVLSDVRVGNVGRLNAEYFSLPLRQAKGKVVNVYKLEEHLQLIQQDVRVEQITARLEPTQVKGQSVLNLQVKESLPYDIGVEISNHYSPNIGSEGIRLSVQHNNLSGMGNQLFTRLVKTQGYLKGGLRYTQPLWARTELDFAIGASRSQVVDNNFKSLDIEDFSQNVNLGVQRNQFQDRSTRLDWKLATFFQHGQTFLLGEPFSFAAGREDGELYVQGLSAGADWQLRQDNQVLSLGISGRFSFAIPDDDDDDELVFAGAPDGQAMVLNYHMQWARKLGLLNARLFSRLNVQMSNAALYGIQQFALGGAASVRGYRENVMVRDNGAFGSMELRVPLWLKAGTRVSLALFADGGSAWQTGRANDGPRVLGSVGGGLVGTLKKYFQVSLYWGKPLRDVGYVGKSNIQDQGIHFSFRSSWR